MAEQSLITSSVELLQATVRFSTPVLFAALGETISERAGVINIGMEGLMLSGAFVGFAGAALFGTPWMGLAFAMLAGALIALLFAYTTVTLRADQVVVGAALNIFCLGFTGFLYRRLFTDSGLSDVVKTFSNIGIPVLKDVPVIGAILFNQNILVYTSLLLVPLIWILFYKTSTGLAIISTGEHPKAADSLGINVIVLRYVAILISGVLAGVGGAFLSIAHSNTFIENMTAGRGFIALAIVILGKWNPLGVLAAAMLFGGANALQLRIQASGNAIPYDLVLMIPYVLTVIAVVMVSKNRVGAPTALGLPYEKA